MSEEKFVICPNCGALLEKGVQFCGFCGSSVVEKKSSYSQPRQPTYQQPPPQQQYGAPGQTTYGQPVYVVGAPSREQEAESKLRLGWIFAWITFCGGSLLFFILTLVFVLQAKNLGSKSPRIRNAIILASVGVVLNTAIIIGFYIWFFSSGFYWLYY